MFPEDLTSQRLYTFWCGIREEAGLPGLRIHDCRHTWASQGVMNGVGLTTVGRMLGHRNRETTAIYAHLDDTALRDAAAQATSVIARAMNFEAEPPPLPEEAAAKGVTTNPLELMRPSGQVSSRGLRTPLPLKSESKSAETEQPKSDREDRPSSLTSDIVDLPTESGPDKANEDEEHRERRRHDLHWL